MKQRPTSGRWRRAHREWLYAIRTTLFAIVSVSLIGGSFPAGAFAQTEMEVVKFEANTRYERSLERFLFDLFNTLQRRQEDFTAAFELQKIEKAREDVNKLFQETQEELQNFGQSIEYPPIRDPRFSGNTEDDQGGFNCVSEANDKKVPGCPPTISPLKDSRIIHDPYQYLFGDAFVKAQIFVYCFFNYLIWDQRGWLPEHYEWLKDAERAEGYDEPKATFDDQGGTSTQRSVNALKAARDDLVVALHRGHYYLLNYPLHEIYGRTGRAAFDETEPRCRQAMYILAAESPVTVEQDLALWKDIRTDDGVAPTSAEEARFRRIFSFLPTLRRSIIGRSYSDGWSWKEFEASEDPRNSLAGVLRLAQAEVNRIIDETQTERQATYIAGQGIRPENLYVTLHAPQDDTVRFRLNTEYVIAPAVLLLQKMQAATQAMFDLAGQGFLYLDAEETPQRILEAYNLVSTRGQNEERRICNNAGSCILLDPWLKPAADFRTTAVLRERTVSATIRGENVTVRGMSPRAIGVNPDLDSDIGGPAAGSGLPAPWEDESAYLNIANEKMKENSDRRYTVARYRLRQPVLGDPVGIKDLSGFDEFDTDGLPPHQDNIAGKQLGIDYPINDWYDRIIEMYEPGLGVRGTDATPFNMRRSTRINRARDFLIRDWQCYVALWFFPQSVRRGSTDDPTFYVGQEANPERKLEFIQNFCGSTTTSL